MMWSTDFACINLASSSSRTTLFVRLQSWIDVRCGTGASVVVVLDDNCTIIKREDWSSE